MKKLVLTAVAIAVLMSAAGACRSAVRGESSDELGDLRARVARLEAKEMVLSTFNQYLYGLDTGFGEDILDVYTEDAILDVPNFGGEDLHFEGRDAIAPLYASYGEGEPRVGGGHHTANIAVNAPRVMPCAERRPLSHTTTAKASSR